MNTALRKFFLPSLRVGVVRSLSATSPLQEKYINRVQLLGRVGRDPEQRGGDSHSSVFFTLATTQTIRSSPEEEAAGLEDVESEKSVTSWHYISVFPPSFQKYVQEYVTKGSRVIVEGSIYYYKSTTPEGTTRVTANIKAHDLIILSTPSRQEEGGSRDPQYVEDFPSAPDSPLR